jgi:hypothetical protein
MAEKELRVYLLAYNLIRLLVAQAALRTGRSPRELSFNIQQTHPAAMAGLGTIRVAQSSRRPTFRVVYPDLPSDPFI